MKRKFLVAILALFAAAINTSLAFISVGNVSVERADELGIELRAKPSGPQHAWVELEFKAEGALSEFQHVSLEIPDGDHLGVGWTPLKDKRTNTGSVIVRMMGSREFLKKTTLRIVIGTLGDSGLDVRLNDFVDFEKLPEPNSSSKSRQAEHGGADQPATALESKPEGREKPKPEAEERSQ